ncbi:MAG: GGDEF domain-containing protein [Pseudomonadota bacterium]
MSSFADEVANTELFDQTRDRTLTTLGATLAVVLLPFSINSYLQGRPLMGVLTSALVICGAVNWLAMRRHRKPPIPLTIWLGLSIITLLRAFVVIGPLATYWCYPVPVMIHFATARSSAQWMSRLFMVIVTPLAFLYLPTPEAFRFIITLALVDHFGRLLIRLIGDLQGRLAELSLRDSLTGAYNRRHLSSCLSKSMAAANRGEGAASLVALDIDHFKGINDSYGHDAGDRVLEQLVALLQERLGTDGMLFRMGGEEFVVLLGDTPVDQAITVAEDLRALVEAAPMLPEQRVTVSLGVAGYAEGQSAEEWLKAADDQLYRSKADGRNRVSMAV